MFKSGLSFLLGRKNTSNHDNFNSGFTIVELLIVIVIIGILAAITIVSYTGISSRATIASLQSDLTNAANQLKLDQVTGSSYPATLALANGGKGVPASAGTTYTYAVSNVTIPQTFCITATKNSTSYNITQDGNSQFGICPVLNLDAGNIASYPGTGTTWTDLSGNGNNGTLNGGVTYSNVNGGVMSFDGINDQVSLPNNLGLGTQELTVSVWINQQSPSLSGSSRPYVSDWNTWQPGSQKGFILRTYDSNTTSSFWLADGVNYTAVYSSQTITLNTWYNVVGVFKSNSIFKIYVNGVERGSGAAPSQYVEETVSPTYIGYGGINAGYFSGQISDVNIYSKALSDIEITQNFNNLRGRYGI